MFGATFLARGGALYTRYKAFADRYPQAAAELKSIAAEGIALLSMVTETVRPRERPPVTATARVVPSGSHRPVAPRGSGEVR